MWYGLTILDSCLWATIIVTDAVLAWICLRSHRANHPAFTTYICISLGKSLALVAIHHFGGPAMYFYAYYLFNGITSIAVGFAAIEVAYQVFAPYNTIPVGHVIRLVGGVLVFAVLAFSIAELAGFPTQGTFWAKLILLERYMHILIAVSLLVVSVTALDLGLPWDEQTKAVCAGLIFAMTINAVSNAFSLYGEQAKYTRPLGMLAFFFAQLVWTQGFLKAPQARYVADDEILALLRNKMDMLKVKHHNVRSVNT
jgi:hypothetical protein